MSNFEKKVVPYLTYLGTRPPLISETNLYELHHRARLAIKPGITGMWQVSGRSDITDFEEVVRLDKEYITNWNIGLDIKILFKPIAWQEGWATEKIRDDASSGGAASSLMKYFVENGGYVATCLFRQGEFVFEITNKLIIQILFCF